MSRLFRLLVAALASISLVVLPAVPAQAAISHSVNSTVIVKPGLTNASDFTVNFSGLGDITNLRLDLVGMTLNQTGKSEVFSSGTGDFVDCPGRDLFGVKSQTTASGTCSLIDDNTNQVISWQFGAANYTEGSVGTTFSFLLKSGAVTFEPNGPYSVRIRAFITNGATSGSYTSVFDVTQQLLLALENQDALSVTSSSGTFGTPLTLTTTQGLNRSTEDQTFSVSDGTATGCNVSSEGVVTSTSAGTCLVTATRAGDSTYASITSAQATITFAKASRTLSFTTSPTSIAYGSTATAVATPSAAGGAVSYASTGSTACTVNSSTGVVTATQSSGTCEITATVTEGTNYLTASVATPLVITTGTKSVTIAASDSTVNFGTSFTTNVLNTGSLGLVGSDSIESSGATFTYQGTSTTVYGPSTVKPVNAGTYSVTPSAAVLATGSTSNYNFTYVAGTVSINKVARTLAFGGGGSATVNYGNTLTVAATPSTGDGAVTYSAGSSTGCSVNASTGVVTANSSTGTCTISASIAAGTNHLTANTTSSFAVTLAKKTITLKTADFEVTVGGDVIPATEVSVGSLVGSDAISSATFTYVGTGTTTYGPSTVAPTEIGTYDVTPSVPVFGTGSATNYTISFAAGTLTISAQPPAPAPSSGGVAAQPVAGPAIAGVTARGSDNGKRSFLRVRLDKTPTAFEQLTVVVRLLDLKGELVEELRIPVSQGASMVEILIDRAMGKFNAVAQISSPISANAATNASAKLRPDPLLQSTIREATEERPARLLGKRLSPPVLFAAESAKLTPAIKRELRKAARAAKESGSRLAVTGIHALSGRGEAFEQSLAEKRAFRVARYLRNRGLDNWILYHGLSSQDGEQFRGQPRRVEIRVLKR